MKQIEVTCVAKQGALLHLPGGIKVWGGHTTWIPESLMENEGVKKYIKSGRLKVVEQSGIIVPSEDKKAAPVEVKKEAAPVEVVDVLEEGPDAIFMGAIEKDGSFTPADQVELTTKAPEKKKRGRKHDVDASEDTSTDTGESE